MKVWLAAPCLAVLTWGFVAPRGVTTLVLTGDYLGNLSPCGCTKPMVGGIRRWATALQTLKQQNPCVVVCNGGLVAGTSRQDELKAESLAESLRFASVAAINLTRLEAKLGKGGTSSIHRLSGEAVVTGSLAQSETLDAKPFAEAGPFLIGGADPDSLQSARSLGESAVDADRAVTELVSEGEARGLAPILLWAGDEESAKGLAKRHPQLKLIVYRGPSPLHRPSLVGTTTLATPGEKGRELVGIDWNGQAFGDYRNIPLGPEFENEADVSRAYARYLGRVDEEDLLAQLPRVESEAYAGSETCFSCHQKAADVWKKSEHSCALKTLEDDHHGRDPDCVSCHVVGLGAKTGYMTRASTPNLANVGCESCHGPGRDHANDPKTNPMGTAGERSCLTCHTVDHSPKFDFKTFWPKIAH